MSLQKAIVDIADRMETLSKTKKNTVSHLQTLLQCFASELRTAATVAGTNVINAKASELIADHRTYIDIERAKIRAEKEKNGQTTLAEETNVPKMVEAKEGPYDGTMVGIPSDMPLGAKTEVEQGEVYVLKAEGLVYSPGGSAARKEQLASMKKS